MTHKKDWRHQFERVIVERAGDPVLVRYECRICGASYVRHVRNSAHTPVEKLGLGRLTDSSVKPSA